MLKTFACLVLAASTWGCAATASGVDDLGPGEEDLAVPDDLSEPSDLFAADLTPPDLMVVCDVDAGDRLCVDKCITPTQCCTGTDCTAPTDGTGVCTNGVCGFSCNVGFKGCGAKCIPLTGCCLAADCTMPPDPCLTNVGATCVNNACSYPPLPCSYTGQTCTAGVCNCPSGEKVCQNAGKCIPNATCCTSSDCMAIVGQVCPAAGGACSCLAGNKTCLASNSCIAQASCCTVADCTFSGQSCSGVGGSCSCPAGQKPCAANNACIANANCCTTADCTGGQTCASPGGSCGCLTAGTYLCAPISTCISTATCCTNANCPISGQVCSGFGGTCSCAAGTKYCATSNSCIPNATCCSNSDCTAISGQVCSAPGGSCGCPGGSSVCGSACRLNSLCCTAADCTLTSHVASATCSGAGVCGVNMCSSGYENPNGSYADGCECQDDSWGKGCGSATSLGTIAVTGSTMRTGVLPLAGEENWFLATFQYTTATNYHPAITLTGTGMVFDVFTSCSLGVLNCTTEGGQSTSRTSWEVQGGGAPTGLTYSPTGSVGTVYIRVRRASGSPTCGTYTLTVSN